MQIVNRDFVRLVPALPAWVPAPGLWPVVSGVLLLAIYVWTNPAKVLALAGAALLVAWPAASATLAAGVLGLFLVICGVQHFVYAGFVDTLVPAWLPPGPRSWTIICGVTLVAGGIGVMWPRTRRPAGVLAGGMIFLWVSLVHVARTVEFRSAFELAGVFEALALAGTAWLVAGAAARAAAAGPA